MWNRENLAICTCQQIMSCVSRGCNMWCWAIWVVPFGHIDALLLLSLSLLYALNISVTTLLCLFLSAISISYTAHTLFFTFILYYSSRTRGTCCCTTRSPSLLCIYSSSAFLSSIYHKLYHDCLTSPQIVLYHWYALVEGLLIKSLRGMLTRSLGNSINTSPWGN